MRPRVIGPLTVAVVLLAWTFGGHAAGFLRWAPAQWPCLLPLMVAWLLLIWGWLNPFWGAAHGLLGLLVGIDLAFTLRQPWLLAWWAGLSVGASVLAALGHGALRARERAAQAAYEAAQEQVNTFQETSTHLDTVTQALSVRLQRYVTLREVTEAFSRHPEDLEALLTAIPDQTLRVLDHAELVLVYLVEIPRHELALRATQRRVGAPPAIKRKTGDLFDQWVLRQGQPLLVRDVARDFRFPQEGDESRERAVGALVAAPLISAQRVLGVLRAEHARAGAFSPDDLRLLDIVADLAAMAVENTRLYLRTAELAVTDDLTGLAVHRYFHERFDEELTRARRRNIPVSVLLIDLDHFKQYNDTYGHPAGDKLLRTIAQSLRRFQGAGDLIARYGGEEFAVLLYGVGREEAARQAETLRAALAAQPIVLRQEASQITVSIGVATFPDDGLQKEEVLQVADQRLYRAKQQGRNQVCAA